MTPIVAFLPNACVSAPPLWVDACIFVLSIFQQMWNQPNSLILFPSPFS